MSQANVEVVRDQYAATNERDFGRAISHYAQDVELVVPAGHLRGGTFRGADEVGRYFGEFFATFDEGAWFDVQEIIEVDESSVLMTGVYHARGRASGVDIAGDVIWLYGLSEGKITSIRWYDSRDEALEDRGAGGVGGF
jgi:ketosteroid isomerase-like protein